MEKGHICIFCGDGRGKTSAALGHGIQAASQGKQVIVIQFMKEKTRDNLGFLHRLEPEIRLFRFERSEKRYADMTPQEQQEEQSNIRNGLNFARKVLTTRSCDVLILDEVLGLLGAGVIRDEEIRALIDQTGEGLELIMTGLYEARELWDLADEVTLMCRQRNCPEKPGDMPCGQTSF